MVMNNKVSTWDHLQNKFWSRPSRCTMCKVCSKNVDQMFIRCFYIVHVFYFASHILGMQFIWTDNNIEEALLTWTQNLALKNYMALPFILI